MSSSCYDGSVILVTEEEVWTTMKNVVQVQFEESDMQFQINTEWVVEQKFIFPSLHQLPSLYYSILVNTYC